MEQRDTPQGRAPGPCFPPPALLLCSPARFVQLVPRTPPFNTFDYLCWPGRGGSVEESLSAVTLRTLESSSAAYWRCSLRQAGRAFLRFSFLESSRQVCWRIQ